LFDVAADQISGRNLPFLKPVLCIAHALLDCKLTIVEPTIDYGFHEIL